MHDEIENAVLEVTARAAVVDVPMREQRSLATVTAEIRAYQDAARRMAVQYSIEIGRRLIEAKEMVNHGEWGSYLREELGFSQSTANNHMAMFRAYAADQMRLDGDNLKNQAFGNLSYTQALALLALPSEEEREAFVQSHDMDKISTRELREELKKRGGLPNTEDPESFAAIEAASLREDFMGEARVLHGEAPADPPLGPDAELLQARLKEAEEEANEVGEQLEKAMEEIKAGKIERDRLAEQAKTAESKQSAAEAQAQAAAEQMLQMKQKLREAERAKRDAQKALQEAKNSPNIPEETLTKLRKEAEEAAAAAHKAEQEEWEKAKKKWEEAEQNASKIRQEAEEAKAEAQAAAEKLASAEKALRMAAPEMAEFRFRVQAAQDALAACLTALGALPDDNKQGGAKVLRKLLEAFGGQLTAQA